MEMNLPLEAHHFTCTFTQGHKLVIPVSPAKYRPRPRPMPSKEPYLFKMMKVRKLGTSPLINKLSRPMGIEAGAKIMAAWSPLKTAKTMFFPCNIF